MLIKPVYDRTPRGIMASGNEQDIKAINATVVIASNNIIHKNIQTSTRLIYTDFKKDNFDKNKARAFNSVRDDLLSSIMPKVLCINKKTVIDLLKHNISVIAENFTEIDSRSINNIAVAKTGMDLLFDLTGLCPWEEDEKINALDDKYKEFLGSYSEQIKVKDAFVEFMEIFSILVQEGKILHNRDWKLSENHRYVAINLKAVYQKFKEQFKKGNDSQTAIPSYDDIVKEAKRQGYETDRNVKYKNQKQSRSLYIDLEKDEYFRDYLLPVLEDSTGRTDIPYVTNM